VIHWRLMLSARTITISLLLFLGGEIFAAETIRILFIGNSYIYVNDLPAVIGELAAAGRQRPVESESETPGGFTLEKHFQEGKARQKLSARKWDYVVLQEQSTRPIYEPAPMLEFGKKFDAEIKRQGAKTLLYLTWARQDLTGTQGNLNHSYRE